MHATSLEQISKKLDEIDLKISALLLKEEKPTKEELRAIKAGEKEFRAGKYRSWKEIKALIK